MGDEGVEPSTNRLRVQCSTFELVTLGVFMVAHLEPTDELTLSALLSKK